MTFTHRLIRRFAPALPFAVLSWLVRNVPLYSDPCDGWNVWLDAHFARYHRFHIALWGGRPS